MKLIIALCLLVAAASGFENALRVRWGLHGDQLPFFIEVPRTEQEVRAAGWVRTFRTQGPMPELKLYCPGQERALCVFFDDLGVIAGLQIALQEDYFSPSFDMESLGFQRWFVPTSSLREGVSYWVTQQFFVSEGFQQKSREERQALTADKTLREDAIYVPNVDGSLLRIPVDEQLMEPTGFNLQACIPTMGTHYYYNMTAESECEQLFPWFTLTDGGAMVATGFVAAGSFRLPHGHVMWFEEPAREAVEAIVPRGPQCLYELASNPGVLTMHIYYDQHPYTLLC